MCLKVQLILELKANHFFLDKGAIIALEGDIPHDLTALQDSVIRLSLSLLDSEKRVENITKTS